MKRIIVLGAFIGMTIAGMCEKASRPFPNHTRYHDGVILPSQITQEGKDKVVTSFYNLWKSKYVKNDCSDQNLFYVYTDEGDKTPKGPVVCVSEGQGYGMVIMAIMAGYDKDAQKIYDGMYRFVKQNPTAKSKDLMSWSILKGCEINHHNTGDEFDNTSATDGDLDIALSLFMADAQWGSNGSINYKEEGIKRLKAILKHEVNAQKHTLLLGDANDPGDFDYFDVRTSDFMPTHLKVFSKFLPNPEWSRIVNQTYKIFSSIQSSYSPKAGLIPDFIVYRKGMYKPAYPNYLEGDTDGEYFYNACRVPLRLGLDYMITGDARARQLLTPLVSFFETKTKGDVRNMYAGYRLTGKVIPKYYYVVPSFMSPLTVGSAVVQGKQKWVNKSWDYISAFKIGDYHYYDSTVHLLSLIALSGNFWLP